MTLSHNFIINQIINNAKKTNMGTKNFNPKEELYKWATIVAEQETKGHPKGEIKYITIIDTYGTVINITINE